MIASKTPLAISKMFDRIAEQYDNLNRFLSFGLDQQWRLELLQYIPKQNPLAILDVATGTGDLLLAILQHIPNVERVLGVDISQKMLSKAYAKLQHRYHRAIVELRVCDASCLQEPDETFDIITMAFGIRNMEDPKHVLSEMWRLLKPHGRLIVLEFSMPRTFWFKQLYLFYFRYIVPFIGGAVSLDWKAYRYLNQSVEEFPFGEDFVRLLVDSGFSEPHYKALTNGIVTLYCANKTP